MAPFVVKVAEFQEPKLCELLICLPTCDMFLHFGMSLVFSASWLFFFASGWSRSLPLNLLAKAFTPHIQVKMLSVYGLRLARHRGEGNMGNFPALKPGSQQLVITVSSL